MNEKEIYQKAIAEWGPDLQLIVLMEECAELIKACSKIIRARKTMLGDIAFEPFIEEMADVRIMIDQMRFGWLDHPELLELFETKRREKLSRVANWLDSEFKEEKNEV